jgi:hypothetical protein
MVFKKGHPNYKKKEDEIEAEVNKRLAMVLGEIPSQTPVPSVPEPVPPEYPHVEPVPTPAPTVIVGKVRLPKVGSGLGWRERMKLSKNPLTTYFVSMIHGNGSFDTFIIDTDQKLFEYNKKWYHLNIKKMLYDANEKTGRLIYHEDYVEPLEPKQIKELGNPAFFAVTPENIAGVIKAECVRLLSESDIMNWLKLNTWILIGVGGAILIILLIQIAPIFAQIGASLKHAASSATKTVGMGIMLMIPRKWFGWKGKHESVINQSEDGMARATS